jgi:hypothetical protein
MCARALLLLPVERLHLLHLDIETVSIRSFTIDALLMASSNQFNFDARGGTFNDVRGDQFNQSVQPDTS